MAYKYWDTLIEQFPANARNLSYLVILITESLYTIFIIWEWIVLLFINITTVQHFIFIFIPRIFLLFWNYS